MKDKGTLHIHDDPHALSRAMAAHWVSAAHEAIDRHGRFHVALAGGSTPGALYERLASDEFRTLLDWQATHVYFGDERCVPPEDAESNYRMAREALLRHVDIPPTQVHRIEAERADRAAAARDYAEVLGTRLPATAGGGAPRFDLILLGLGTDGHIASLFPHTDALDERSQLVVPVYVEKLAAWRISLTYPVLEAACGIALMVCGRDKAGIIGEVLGDRRHEGPAYPVERLSPRGRLDWYIDRAAAAALPASEGG